jgi:hypothetical protein
MAETEKKPADPTNWADMDHEGEEEDQEIGLQQKETPVAEGGAAEESKEGAVEAQSQEGGVGAAANKDGKYPRKKKDYGDKYNPNYKKGAWRKGQGQ